MERLSHILESHETKVYFYCAGCKMLHGVQVRGDQEPLWGWNGDCVKPTFTPSVLVRGTFMLNDEERAKLDAGIDFERRPLVCHSFVTDGQIAYLSDSTHELAGQTVPLSNLDDEA